MARGRKNWKLRLAFVLALLVAAGVAVHFGPRYIYSFFGDWALKEVESKLGPTEQAKIQTALKGLKARVVWSSSRSGNHEIYLMKLPDLTLHQLTKNDFVDYFPRFSPNGRSIVFARSQKKWVSERNPDLWDTYILSLDNGQEKLLAKHANFPLWVDAKTVSFMRGPKVVLKDIATGGEKIIFDGAKPPVRGRIETPELSPTDHGKLALTARGKLRGVIVVDLAKGGFTNFGDGCEITWFPDGKSVLWVDDGGRGKTRVVRSPAGRLQKQMFMDLPGKFSHEYFPRLSQDGKWMAWAASAGGHEHDIADYEIFLWNTTRPMDQAVRLTYSKANDRWPDIFVD